jgi:hypothetical protein
VVEVTDIGIGELWFESIRDGLSQRQAERRARKQDSYIAIPETDEMPEDWGQQFLDGELKTDPYA